MFISLRGCEVFWAKWQSCGVLKIWVFWADVSAEHMLVDLRDNMQPHDSIRRSPPFIKVLTHSAYSVAVFTCKYLGTDRFLSWRACFRKSPLRVCTLLKEEPCRKFQQGFPVIILFLTVPDLILTSLSYIFFCRGLNPIPKDMLLKYTTQRREKVKKGGPSLPFWQAVSAATHKHRKKISV